MCLFYVLCYWLRWLFIVLGFLLCSVRYNCSCSMFYVRVLWKPDQWTRCQQQEQRTRSRTTNTPFQETKQKRWKLMTRAILQNTVDVVSVHCVFVWCFVLLIVLFLWWLIFGLGVLIFLLCFCSRALSLLFVFRSCFSFIWFIQQTTNSRTKNNEQTQTNEHQSTLRKDTLPTTRTKDTVNRKRKHNFTKPENRQEP